MSDVFNNPTKTYLELQQEADAILKSSFPTIDTSTPSPQGNLLNLITFARSENQDSFTKAQNELNIASATNENLDNLCYTLNLAKRNFGGYTLQDVKITFLSATTIYGLDQTAQEIFTVSDNNGNNYKLQLTQEISIAGTYSLSFRAENKGAIISAIGTITNGITKNPYITNIINDSNPSEVGSIYEIDPVYRSRALRTRAKSSQFIEDSIEANLIEIAGVNDVYIFNNRNSIAINGVPDRTMYVIVEGGNSDLIAEVLAKNSICTPYHGNEIKYVKNAKGNSIKVQYDIVSNESIYIKFNIKSNLTLSLAVLEAIKVEFANQIFVQNIFKIGSSTNVFILDKYLKNAIDNLNLDAYCYDLRISKDNVNWFTDLSPTLLKNKFDITSLNIQITVA